MKVDDRLPEEVGNLPRANAGFQFRIKVAVLFQQGGNEDRAPCARPDKPGLRAGDEGVGRQDRLMIVQRHHAALFGDQQRTGAARGLHPAGVEPPEPLDPLLRRLIRRTVGKGVERVGVFPLRRVIADQFQQAADGLRTAGGGEIAFGLHRVERVGGAVHRRRQKLDDHHFHIRRGPAAAVGEAVGQLLHHEEAETVPVAGLPVEIVRHARQGRRQGGEPLSAVGATCVEDQLRGGKIGHGCARLTA